MKKEILMIMAAAAVLVGCHRADNSANEPAGADRSMNRKGSSWNTNSLSTNSLSTNSIFEPSGAARDLNKSSDLNAPAAGSSQLGTNSAAQGTNSQSPSGAATP